MENFFWFFLLYILIHERAYWFLKGGDLMGLKKLIRKSKGKKKNQIKHARKRFLNRFDIDLNDNQYIQLVNKIQKGRGELVRRQSNRVSIWDIEFEGQMIRVVYDKKTKAIVTALYPPREKLIEYEERSNNVS